MSLDTIKKADLVMKKYLTYKTESKDKWVSYFQEILDAEKSGKTVTIYGDCDDWAMTAIDLAAYYGANLTDLGRIICWANVGKGMPREGHMVAIYANKGNYYYFGDTFGPVCNIKDRDHEIKMVNWLKDGKEWITW
jgi:hypothetical protein